MTASATAPGRRRAEGLIHLSELSWQRISAPDAVVKKGDRVRVKVVGVDKRRRRITLSLKQLSEDPIKETLEDLLPLGDSQVMALGVRSPRAVLQCYTFCQGQSWSCIASIALQESAAGSKAFSGSSIAGVSLLCQTLLAEPGVAHSPSPARPAQCGAIQPRGGRGRSRPRSHRGR